ncbi:MAG: tetratricopeptide repeat protein [Bacteroidia bacterium]|nr:tetratricopeptide repeat protein [Bacteroidia bacterium]
MKKFLFLIFFTFLFCLTTKNSYAQTAEQYADSGFKKFATQDYIGAIKNYSSAIELNSKNDNYYNIRGYSYYKIGKLKESVDDFNKAIELKPKFYMYYLSRAYSKKAIFDKDGACSDFKIYQEMSGFSQSDEIKKYCEGQ